MRVIAFLLLAWWLVGIFLTPTAKFQRLLRGNENKGKEIATGMMLETVALEIKLYLVHIPGMQTSCGSV